MFWVGRTPMHPHTLRNPPDPPRQCPHFSEILILPSPKFPYTSCWKPPLRASNFSKFSGEDPTATVNWENHSMAGRGIFKSLILLPPPSPLLDVENCVHRLSIFKMFVKTPTLNWEIYWTFQWPGHLHFHCRCCRSNMASISPSSI